MNRAATIAALVVAVGAGCSGSQLPHYEAADALKARARQEEAAGSLKNASDLYIECLLRCPDVARMVGEDLKRVVRHDRKLEDDVWDAVREIEAQALQETSSAKLAEDAAALTSIYSAWDRPDRAVALVKKMKSRSPLEMYETALRSFVVGMPEAFSSLDSNDAVLLVAAAETEPSRDRVVMKVGGYGADMEADLERGRVDHAVGFAIALLRSGNKASAHRVVEVAIQGLSEPRCRKMVGVALKRQDAPLRALVCEECSDDPECSKAEPEAAAVRVVKP